PLREWIRARLARRGVRAHVDDIVITSGSQQGIDLVSRALLDPGDAVAVESPSYLAALQCFTGCEAELVPIASDDGGMQIDALERALAERPIKLIYLVPEFQNPKGTTLAPERRARLVELAAAHGVVVLEDDPYGELRFRGEAAPPLAAYDDAGVVVHLGTFSKTLAPGLRIAWLTGPREIVRAVTVAKQAADLHTATLAQRATARLLASFDYDAHVGRIRVAYGARCDAMLASLARHMPAGTRWTNPDGGLFVWVELPRGLSADDVFAEALREKVAFVPGSGFFPGAVRREFLRLNFSNRPEALIEEGMSRLGAVLRRRLPAD
ncbi:MAG TPA: PLP-dependent aminotransferase family protein, partial [Byssovorax sp.]